jgi:hypothetical protein
MLRCAILGSLQVTAGEVRPSPWVIRGAGIVYRGTYFEVPVVNITSPDDAISQLVDVKSLDIH